jgi:hypothetical protein
MKSTAHPPTVDKDSAVAFFVDDTASVFARAARAIPRNAQRFGREDMKRSQRAAHARLTVAPFMK